jgi:hypothetical protein
MAKWAELANAEAKAIEAAKLVAATAPEAKLPELPPNLRRCLSVSKQRAKQPVRAKQKNQQQQKAEADKKLAELAQDGAAKEPEVQAKTSSADALVLAMLETARKRDACARLLLQWYEKNVKPPTKVAAAKK